MAMDTVMVMAVIMENTAVITAMARKRKITLSLIHIYILFLANTVVSYLFAYKSSIIYADQRSYMLSIYSTVISLLRLALQSISLILWKNYIIYLPVSYTHLDVYKRQSLSRSHCCPASISTTVHAFSPCRLARTGWRHGAVRMKRPRICSAV